MLDRVLLWSYTRMNRLKTTQTLYIRPFFRQQQ